MAASIAEISAQALQLPPEDRAQLADQLLASLGIDEGQEQAWSAEADRRLAELDIGAVREVPIEETIARARSAIR